MNILLLASYEESWPYIPELIYELEKRHHRITLLDPFSLSVVSGNQKKSIKRFPWFFYRMPIMRRLFRNADVKTFIHRIKQYEYDVCSIHPALMMYLPYVRYLRMRIKRIVLTVWGSDFYRADVKTRSKQVLLYEKMDAIIFGNSVTSQDFSSHYGEAVNSEKFVCPFGIGMLEIISRLRNSEDKDHSKKILGIPEDAFVICCGYNAIPEQQHEIMISSLAAIKDRLPKETLLLFQLSYPKNDPYINSITGQLNDSGLNYKVIDSFLCKDDVARIRIISDVVINIQKTDQRSASIQEHLFCGGTVIAGEWLPYSFFKEKGIRFFQSSISELGKTILSAIADKKNNDPEYSKNTSIIKELSGWETRIKEWENIFSGNT